LPRATGICALLRAPAAALHTTAVLLPLPPPPPPRASHSAACWLWPRGLSAGVSPAGPLRRTRVSFTLVFLRKSVVLTSTMSSKHSYARSGERGEKREDGQQGERKSGERRGTWGKESEQTIRQNTGGRRGGPNGTLLSPLSSPRRRGKREERREESKERTEQNRTEEERRERKSGAAGELHGTTCEKGQKRWQKLSVTCTWMKWRSRRQTARYARVKTGHVLLSFHDVQRSPRARGTPTETQWPRATYTVCTSVLEAPGRSSLARRPENRNPPSRLCKTGIYF